MDDSPAGSILLFVLFLFLSAYFAGTETSLASVNRIHMMSKAGAGDRNASRVLFVLDRFDEALSVLLIGNNIVHIGCATLSVVIATYLWGDSAVTLSTVVTTAVIFLFGEMIPKRFARSCNEQFAERSAGVLILLMKVMKPLSAVSTALSALAAKPFRKAKEEEVTVTEDELHTLVNGITEEDGIDEETGRLVKSALQFSASKASEIMTPWEDVQKIPNSLKIPEILEIVKQSPHSRIPVTDRAGNVRGILSIRSFLKAYRKRQGHVILASVTDYPYFIKPDTPLDDLLSAMSNHRRNLAVVRGEGGALLGIITVEDILEELVGEIYDENDVGGGENE